MDPEVSNTELWRPEYWQKSYDSILAVHKILCKAVKFKNVKVRKQDYLSIIPLNRRFNF